MHQQTGGIREVPHAHGSKSQVFSRNRYTWFAQTSASDGTLPTVFDEPLILVIPRALVLMIVWVAWSFFWAGITFQWLGKHYASYPCDGSNICKHVTFTEYWYFVVLNSTATGTNDITPIDQAGHIWMSVYVIFTVAFLYALISVL